MTDPKFLRGLLLPALLAAIAVVAASRLTALRPIGPLTTALLLGLVAGALWRLRLPGGALPSTEAKGIAFAARTLLRLGVVLVGIRLDLALVRDAGWRILLLDAAVVTIGLLLLLRLGKWLGVPAPLAVLLAVGSSICGASAVAAAKDCARADDDDVAIGIALCGIVGTSAVLACIGLRPLLDLPIDLYGIWAGATIHEVAQVLAAVAPVPEAVPIATVTKLTRVLFLPIVVVVLEIALHPAEHRRGRASGAPIVPGFVIGFVVVAILNTLAGMVFDKPMLAPWRGAIAWTSSALMTIAMAAAGIQIHWDAVRRTGRPALLTMVLGAIGISLVGYWAMRWLGIGG